MSKSRDILLAFLAGAAAGAIAGILFAPDKGKNTREKLSAELEAYKDKLRVLLDNALAEGFSKSPSETPDSSQSKSIVNHAQEEAEKLLKDVEALIDQIRNRKES